MGNDIVKRFYCNTYYSCDILFFTIFICCLVADCESINIKIFCIIITFYYDIILRIIQRARNKSKIIVKIKPYE